MSKAIERRTVLTVGEKITRANIIDEGKNVEIFTLSECSDEEYIEEYFSIVAASTLSTEDEAFKYEPQTAKQKDFKDKLLAAIESGLSDFRAQKMDPSFDDEGKICFCAGMKPAVGKSANWWKKNAEKFMPEKGSRIGTTKERIAFLGFLIKYLVEENGYTVGNAWEAVCDQSKDLGHYWDSENAKHKFESTGSREIGEWYDLANTYKIAVDDKAGGFSLVGGGYGDDGVSCPLAGVNGGVNPYYERDGSVGWLVLSK